MCVAQNTRNARRALHRTTPEAFRKLLFRRKRLAKPTCTVERASYQAIRVMATRSLESADANSALNVTRDLAIVAKHLRVPDPIPARTGDGQGWSRLEASLMLLTEACSNVCSICCPQVIRVRIMLELCSRAVVQQAVPFRKIQDRHSGTAHAAAVFVPPCIHPRHFHNGRPDWYIKPKGGLL